MNMTLNHWLVLATMAFCCVLPAHGTLARQRGWRTGELFATGEKPTMVGIACLLIALLWIGYTIYQGSTSWFFLLYSVLAYFGGGPVLWAIFGANAGWIALIAAPVLTIAWTVL